MDLGRINFIGLLSFKWASKLIFKQNFSVTEAWKYSLELSLASYIPISFSSDNVVGISKQVFNDFNRCTCVFK